MLFIFPRKILPGQTGFACAFGSPLCKAARNKALDSPPRATPQFAALIRVTQGSLHFVTLYSCDLDSNGQRQSARFDLLNQVIFAAAQEAENTIDIRTANPSFVEI